MLLSLWGVQGSRGDGRVGGIQGQEVQRQTPLTFSMGECMILCPRPGSPSNKVLTKPTEILTDLGFLCTEQCPGERWEGRQVCTI